MCRQAIIVLKSHLDRSQVDKKLYIVDTMFSIPHYVTVCNSSLIYLPTSLPFSSVSRTKRLHPYREAETNDDVFEDVSYISIIVDDMTLFLKLLVAICHSFYYVLSFFSYSMGRHEQTYYIVWLVDVDWMHLDVG